MSAKQEVIAWVEDELRMYREKYPGSVRAFSYEDAEAREWDLQDIKDAVAVLEKRGIATTQGESFHHIAAMLALGA